MKTDALAPSLAAPQVSSSVPEIEQFAIFLFFS